MVILLVCLVSFNAISQMDTQQLQYLKKVEKYRRVRNLGMVMVIAGATMGIVGFTRIINTSSASYPRDQDVILWVAGAPFFSAGIPLSIVGHNNMKKYEKKLRANSGLSLNLQLAPQRTGLMLTYRF